MAKRTGPLSIALAAALLPAGVGAAPAEVTYRSGDETVRGYLALPEGPGPFPALVVIHEYWGLNDWVKGKARALAAKGYAALAVDLYRGKVADDPEVAHQLMRGMPEDRARRDLQGAFDSLAARKDVDPARIGAIGWCMGGGLALDLAVAEPRLAAAVVYYGRMPTDPATIASIKAPVLGNFGAEDKGIPPEAVKAFASAAASAGVQVDAKVYPGAGHAFASGNPKAYVPGAAKDADARTDAFLARALKRKG
jgi:carboxymethylenebutenolidase